MRALVTGGAGFIGSHLCEELSNNGFDVTVWDNLFRGRIENLEGMLKNNNYFYKIDMSQYSSVKTMKAVLLNERPEYIFHYAAINGTQYFYDMPARVLDTNIQITANLMKAIKEVKQEDNSYSPIIIYASSSEVYGEPLSIPSSETDITYADISHPRDSYAVSKLAGEFYVRLYAQELDIKYIILRLFNVYGPRMVGTKYGQVIPEFIARLKNGEYPLRIYGNGEHRRSFIYVTDNVKDTVRLVLSNAGSGVYNIGNDLETSILELGSSIMRIMGKEPEFEFLPERQGDHMRRRPDTTKIHEVIGESGYIGLTEGLNRLCKDN